MQRRAEGVTAVAHAARCCVASQRQSCQYLGITARWRLTFCKPTMSLPESPSLNDQIDELIRHADAVRPLPPLPLIDYVDMALRHIVAKEDAEE